MPAWSMRPEMSTRGMEREPAQRSRKFESTIPVSAMSSEALGSYGSDVAELLQRLERAVDGRRGHGVRAVGGHGIHDLVGGGVPEAPHGGQDALALRRQALAPRPQPLPEITHPTNVCGTQTTSRPRTYTDRVTDQGVESLTQGGGDSDETRTEGERRDRRGVKRALIALLALFVFLFGGAAAFVGYLGYTVNDNVTHAELLPENRPPVTAPDGTKVAEKGTGTNFLVIGTDTRPGDAGRSDVIVLVHIPADGKTVNMIHFPRDLYVDIPGHGKNKINAAYAFGREPLLVQTMENLLKIRIHHVAKTNFDGLQEHDGCRGRRPRVRRGGEQRHRQRRPGRHQEGLEQPQRRAGPGLRARALHAQPGRHLPRPPPAGASSRR